MICEIPDRSMLSTVSGSTAMLPWKIEHEERAVASAWLLRVVVPETEQGEPLLVLDPPNCATKDNSQRCHSLSTVHTTGCVSNGLLLPETPLAMAKAGTMYLKAISSKMCDDQLRRGCTVSG